MNRKRGIRMSYSSFILHPSSLLLAACCMGKATRGGACAVRADQAKQKAYRRSDAIDKLARLWITLPARGGAASGGTNP